MMSLRHPAKQHTGRRSRLTHRGNASFYDGPAELDLGSAIHPAETGERIGPLINSASFMRHSVRRTRDALSCSMRSRNLSRTWAKSLGGSEPYAIVDVSRPGTGRRSGPGHTNSFASVMDDPRALRIESQSLLGLERNLDGISCAIRRGVGDREDQDLPLLVLVNDRYNDGAWAVLATVLAPLVVRALPEIGVTDDEARNWFRKTHGFQFLSSASRSANRSGTLASRSAAI